MTCLQVLESSQKELTDKLDDFMATMTRYMQQNTSTTNSNNNNKNNETEDIVSLDTNCFENTDSF